MKSGLRPGVLWGRRSWVLGRCLGVGDELILEL